MQTCIFFLLKRGSKRKYVSVVMVLLVSFTFKSAVTVYQEMLMFRSTSVSVERLHTMPDALTSCFAIFFSAGIIYFTRLWP